jgi:acyl carrier protein
MRLPVAPLAIVAMIPAACGAPSAARPVDPQIVARVQHVISEHLGIPRDQVTRNAKLMADLGADSLDIVEIVMAIEEEFGISYSDEDAAKAVTVGDMIDYVAAHQKK